MTSNNRDHDMRARFLTGREVDELLGISARTRFRWVASGHLPAPVRIGKQRVGWPVEMVESWLTTLGDGNLDRRKA